jgi:hypothetical protein
MTNAIPAFIMDLPIVMVAGGLVACALVLKVFAGSWQSARDIDRGVVSPGWLIEQRGDRNSNYYS